jgi:hypothetical protein
MASRLERLAPLSGLAAAILLALGLAIMSGPAYGATEQVAADYFTRSAGRIGVGHYFGYLSAISLLWFVGSVYGALRAPDKGPGRLASIALGGGVFAAGAVLAGSGAQQIGGEIASSPIGISLETAALVQGLYSRAMAAGLSVGLAAFIGATGVGALRFGSLPAWLGWVSVVMGVTLLTPLHWLAEGLAIPWMAFVGVWLFVKNPSVVEKATFSGGIR